MRNETGALDAMATTVDAVPMRQDREPAGARLMRRIGGVVKTADELQAYLGTVTRAVEQEVVACDKVAITLLADISPETTVSTAGPTPEEARRAAYGSLLAVPLDGAGERLGTLTLYAVRTDAFDERDEAVVRLAAQHCADRIAAALEIIRARTLAAQLEDAMGSRAVIEQAKGILMGLRGTTAQEAFEILRKESQHRNVRVRDLAEHIVTTARGALAGGKGPG